MIERKHKALATAYLAIDVIAVNLAMLAAYVLRFTVEVIPVTRGPQEMTVYTHLLPLVTILFPLVFALEGLYRMRPTRRPAEELLEVAVGTGLGTLLLSGVLLWIRPGNPDVPYSRATLGIFSVCAVVLLMTGRTMVRLLVEKRFRAGHGLDRVLIAGSGELALAVFDRIASHRELGLQIVGFVSDDPESKLDGLPRLGGLADAPGVIEEHRVDHVYVALPHKSAAATVALLDELSREYVSVHVVPDLLQYMVLRSRVEDLDGLPTINLSEAPLDGSRRIVKRIFDVVMASVALIVASPLIAVIAMAVWIEDRGPIFFRQTRMGLDGVPFEIIKFRSMRVDAEEISGAVWAEKDDPRCTKVGRVTRRWSLDELPQLWNVVRGDMSLVGPRPERPEFVTQFRREFPHYMLRHKVRAGITGWAQVHGWRGNTSVRMRIEHDLYYIENWSLLLDVKILVMTLRHGFRHENAY
ncbi:MAG: undecaprenyl-phosphate glucose phosphotransferase [Thermoanaerobaculia bacterium]